MYPAPPSSPALSLLLLASASPGEVLIVAVAGASELACWSSSQPEPAPFATLRDPDCLTSSLSASLCPYVSFGDFYTCWSGGHAE